MEPQYMKRALALAEKGRGYTNPNPLVGAVIVKDNRIIGEGYHQVYGGKHAEINAFDSATEDVAGAHMYVTLEPCAHYGKTPPCAEAIVAKGIKKVVVGLQDPNPLVSGKGIEILRNAGIEVVTWILEKEGRRLNEAFLKYITTGRPFCTMKTAMTLDGKIAAYTGDSKWITGEAARAYVHQLRHQMAAIMVGIGTVLVDDPLLTTRLEKGEGKDAVRVIVDSRARIPLEARVLTLQSEAPTLIAVTELASAYKLKALKEKGAELISTPLLNGGVDLAYLMKALGERKLDSVLLEGGSTLNEAALRSGIVDKVNLFIAPKMIGGAAAKTPVGGLGYGTIQEGIDIYHMAVQYFEKDIMIEGYLKEERDIPCSQA